MKNSQEIFVSNNPKGTDEYDKKINFVNSKVKFVAKVSRISINKRVTISPNFSVLKLKNEKR